MPESHPAGFAPAQQCWTVWSTPLPAEVPRGAVALPPTSDPPADPSSLALSQQVSVLGEGPYARSANARSSAMTRRIGIAYACGVERLARVTMPTTVP